MEASELSKYVLLNCGGYACWTLFKHKRVLRHNSLPERIMNMNLFLKDPLTSNHNINILHRYFKGIKKFRSFPNMWPFYFRVTNVNNMYFTKPDTLSFYSHSFLCCKSDNSNVELWTPWQYVRYTRDLIKNSHFVLCSWRASKAFPFVNGETRC